MLAYNYIDSSWHCVCETCGFQSVYASDDDHIISQIIVQFKTQGWKFIHDVIDDSYCEDGYCPNCTVEAISFLQENKLIIFSKIGSIMQVPDQPIVPTLPIVRNFLTCYDAVVGDGMDWVPGNIDSVFSFIQKMEWPFIDSWDNEWMLADSMLTDIFIVSHSDTFSIGSVLSLIFGDINYENTVAQREFFAEYLLTECPGIINTMYNNFWSKFVIFFSTYDIPLTAGLPCSVAEFRVIVDSLYDANIRDYFDNY